jgi:hypothetical protein
MQHRFGRVGTVVARKGAWVIPLIRWKNALSCGTVVNMDDGSLLLHMQSSVTCEQVYAD